ncbi:MAG: hypothetical protein Q9163_001879 [Psora crenata]
MGFCGFPLIVTERYIRHSPIIVGEQYELAETLAARYGGEQNGSHLGGPDDQTALLSMSGYEGKHEPARLSGRLPVVLAAAAASAFCLLWARFLLANEQKADFSLDSNGEKSANKWAEFTQYHASRPTNSSVGLTYAQGGLIDASARNKPLFSNDPNHLDYGPTTLCKPRSTYEASQSRVTSYPIPSAPEVKSFNPQQGTSGTPVHVYLSSNHDLLAPPALPVSMTFATKRVPADMTRLETTGPSFEYMVLSIAPQYSETASSTPRVQLRLQLHEEAGQDTGGVDIGHFEYAASKVRVSTQNLSQKRKICDEHSLCNASDKYGQYPFPSEVSSAYPTSLHLGRFTPYARAQNRQRYCEPSPMASPVPMQTSMGPHTQQASDWSPTFTSLSNRRMVNSAAQSLSLYSSSASNPILVRTTTLPQSGSPRSTPTAASSNDFNPYKYPQKAVLEIHGDLNSMTEGWTPTERSTKRRLVQFSRSQAKTTIEATFAPVAPDERQPHNICISCIWWEERQECFATSVDTIQLLEQLVALRFTVEEKNRIRRNLEGFHPETVSKGKADSGEFFKLIMGFPNPKPRNIEKDVKVFPWKILGHALKKIISKYSASYSSIAGTLQRPRNPLCYQSWSGSYDGPGYRPSSDHTGSPPYIPILKSQTSHYSEIPTTSGLPSIPSDYSLASHPNQYDQERRSYLHRPVSTLSHIYNTSGQQERSDPTSDHESPRHHKRPRANTSGASSYSQEQATSFSGHMPRSYSEQPNNMRLLSHVGSYVKSPLYSRYDQHEQATSGLTQS